MPEEYITVQGDTWDKIAYNLYGDEAYMKYLVEENQEYLDILVFPSGITLSVPEIPEDAEEDMPEWRYYDEDSDDSDIEEIGGEEFDEDEDEYPDEDAEDADAEVVDEDE